MPRTKSELAGSYFERGITAIQQDLERSESNIELWGGSLQAVLEDLAEIEAKEGTLDPEDPRLTAVKICMMRLEESKALTEILREQREEVVNAARMN